ncbi:YaaL family protein [Chryseomicrobium sp. FSL W7-1435]|uniref:YaaL family protein n=1 Tax=Chryseomicrobium sp. FSL W7-1435 TaxID=2921704 RepID=UPI003159A8D8
MALFSRRAKIKKEFDARFIRLLEETREDWHTAQAVEAHLDDYDLDAIAKRKTLESIHFYLYGEAKRRQVVYKRK